MSLNHITLLTSSLLFHTWDFLLPSNQMYEHHTSLWHRMKTSIHIATCHKHVYFCSLSLQSHNMQDLDLFLCDEGFTTNIFPLVLNIYQYFQTIYKYGLIWSNADISLTYQSVRTDPTTQPVVNDKIKCKISYQSIHDPSETYCCFSVQNIQRVSYFITELKKV